MKIRKIQKEDNKSVKDIIKKVMPEFGAGGDGFAINDPEVERMFEAYNENRHVYFVAEKDGITLGGAGIAPLKGAGETVCELQKMYLLPESRGLGLGKKMIEACMSEAKEMGYQTCYLETLEHMEQARKLYEKNGFSKLEKPMGNTGHFGCNNWYAKKL